MGTLLYVALGVRVEKRRPNRGLMKVQVGWQHCMSENSMSPAYLYACNHMTKYKDRDYAYKFGQIGTLNNPRSDISTHSRAVGLSFRIRE